jgi:hypothetical protein
MATSEVHYIARSFIQALSAMEMSHKINGPQHGIFRAMHRRLWACKPRATQSRPRPLGRLNTERLRHVGAVVMQTSLTAAYNVYQWPANSERRNSAFGRHSPSNDDCLKTDFGRHSPSNASQAYGSSASACSASCNKFVRTSHCRVEIQHRSAKPSTRHSPSNASQA